MVLLYFCLLFCIGNSLAVKYDSFPDKFVFGVGTSSYQIEGAWNVSGKGESVWDRITHTTDAVLDGSNGDVACDSYHKYQDDISMLKQLKVHCYRFSLSWPRLFPTGTVNIINQDGVNYYNNLIDGLLDAGISPMVTIFHWDTPQVLQDLGGWNSDQMVVWFREYADKVFELFGDRVKVWATVNEPATYCYSLYKNTGIGSYLCGHNIIKAHAEVYHLYKSKYKCKQNGRVGITLNAFWGVPMNPKSETDQIAAENAMESYFGWFAWPIFKTGDYPLSMRHSVDRRSKEQGFSTSRLPRFSMFEKLMIYKSSDYLGLNYYSTLQCTFGNQPASAIPTKDNDDDILISINPNWKTTSVPGFTITPDSLRKLLLWVGEKLGHYWPIDITENGYNGDANKGLDDPDRVDYLNGHVEAVLNAMNQGANVKGYTYWSLMDNFEWNSGYTRKFGLYNVDFNDENRTRTARKSAMVFQNIIVTRKVDPDFYPKNFVH